MVAGLDQAALNRFWSKVERGTGCWNWVSQKQKDGYGWFRVQRDYRLKGWLAHRVAYEAMRGPIPQGLQIDHLCRNRACVNPAHMEAVTQKVNILRGEGWAANNARLSTCKRGHPLEGENLRIRTSPRYGRECRACDRDKHRARYVPAAQRTKVAA